MSTETAENDGFETREFVYQGRYLHSNGKTFYAIAPLLEPDAPGAYSKNPQMPVGAVFSMDAKDTTIRLSSARYLRPFGDQVAVREWRARDLATEVELSRKSLNTKARKVEPLEEILAPIRELSGRLTRSEKRALAVRILEVLA